MKKIGIRILLLAAITIQYSCKKEDPLPPGDDGSYTVPGTYSFSNMNYAGQTTRLGMMQELEAYMKTANTSGVSVSATTMKEMFANTNNPFADTSLNNSTKQIKDKTFSLDQAMIESYMDSLAQASQSLVAGSNGTAGVLTSGSNNYLCDANGIEWNQVITKTLMGAFIYYQIADNYLSDAKIGNGVDNSTVTPGEGTAMEHHWDEAFGYYGVPTDFPGNTSGLLYWGKYCDGRNALMNTNSIIMNAFVKGRAAISNKDYTTRDQQRDIIRTNLEKVIAASAIHYINSAKSNISDDALRNHALSECIGFANSLKYSPVKVINQTQIDQVKAYIGDNLYNVTINDLDNAKDLLSSIYGLDGIKNSL